MSGGGLVAGSRVAGYLLEEQVGAGGMAVVFRARDERLSRLVALKVLAPALAQDAGFRQRFIRESRAVAAVDDPHIIPVFEAGEAGGVLFIAMRYVPGSDVRTLLQREGPLPEGRAAAIISAVASALDAAHAAGLVHRDVKPANMLIDMRLGRPDHVYLSDFELSKTAVAATTGLTGAGLFLGTLDYISPEQLQARPVDGRADQYGLACAAFELLAGSPPFQRDQAAAVMYAHLSEPPPPLVSRRPDIPPAVDQVLARAMAKASAERYACCREFAEALRAALGLAPYAQVPGDGGHADGPGRLQGAETANRPGPEACAVGRSAPGSGRAGPGMTELAKTILAVTGAAAGGAHGFAPGLSSFVGRADAMAEVAGLLGGCRLVTVTGPGGVGKTRLAGEVARRVAGGFADGAWLVELAAVTDQDAVAPATASALGIAGQRGRPVAETLVDALAPQDILIVLDNCEHLIGGCAKTAELIVRRCPGVHLLATSREPLGIGGETVYRVPSLSLPGSGDNGPPAAGSSDAVALFVDRARTQGVSLAVDGQTAELVVSVCRRLDGMPLAIELAAARLRTMSLASLHDRLDQRFRLLTGGSRTALARQQTLRATVEWSYSLLNGAEQVLLRRLPVFADSFDLDAAEAVCGFGDLDALDVAGLLGSLADKSLAGAEPAGAPLRYRLLETIRQFAAERLAEAGEDEAGALTAAHSAHFLSVAEAAAPHLTGPDQGQWLARLDAEQANLRRAAGHAAGDPEGTARVLRFGVALRRYWMARYRDEEACGLLMPALQRPDARADPRLFGAALVAAVLTARATRSGTARQLGELALEFARQLGDERLLIESLAASCDAYFRAGEPETGRPLGQEAVERARQLGDDVLLGESLMEYLLCSDLIAPARYRQLFAEAIACTTRSGDQLMSRYLYNNAGVQALQAGDISAARAHLDAAAQAMQAIGENSAVLPANLGWVLRQEGDPDAARSMFAAGLRAARRNGDHAGIAYASLGLACLAADRGDWHQAGVLQGVAQAFLDRAGEPWQDPEARYRRESLDDVRARLGDDQADRAYAEGMALGVDEALDLALGT